MAYWVTEGSTRPPGEVHSDRYAKKRGGMRLGCRRCREANKEEDLERVHKAQVVLVRSGVRTGKGTT